MAIVSIQHADGRPLALLANYSLHYVGGYAPGHVSADYFAMFVDRIQQSIGADRQTDLAAMTVANRILGYVNAPALMQRVVACMQGMSVDISEYARKRDLLCDGLAGFGYEFVKPPGTFYLFPRSPIPDDVEFSNALKEERVLVVPGSGFDGPGHFRIAFCVDDEVIKNSMPGFQKALERYK